MIRTDIVALSTVKGVAYRQKLPSGSSGIVIIREDAAQPGIASISKTSGEAIPAKNTPKKLYPQEAFKEAMTLTLGMPYKKQGAIKLNGETVSDTSAPEEALPEEAAVDSADYLKIVEKYTDKNGKFSYDLLNKDMIKFAHSSSKVRKMLEEGGKQKDIVSYSVGTKFRNITGNSKLSDEQVQKIADLLDEVSPKGVLKEFKSEIRKKMKTRAK